jgi:hypothetical protein
MRMIRLLLLLLLLLIMMMMMVMMMMMLPIESSCGNDRNAGVLSSRLPESGGGAKYVLLL